jgi:Ser/Thr protein kinase RdoA (MazF antagonist)
MISSETSDRTSMFADVQNRTAVMQDIANFFSLGVVTTIFKSNTGRSNLTFFVNTDEDAQYVVRISKTLDTYDLENEFFIQDSLRSSYSLTNCMLTSRNGDLYYHQGGIYATVSGFIKGHHPQNPVPLIECYLIGKALAQFHQSFHGKYLPNAGVGNLLDIVSVQSRLDHLTPGVPRERLATLFSQSRIAAEDRGLPKGVIHGDLHVENVLIHRRHVAMLDLQNVGEENLILDIGRSIADVCSYSRKLDLEKVASFLDGYKVNRQLMQKEKELIGCAIAYGAAATGAWFYEYGDYGFGDHFLDVGFAALNAYIDIA